jgi:signal transduction histidine kinase
MTTTSPPPCTPELLRSLFLFESLSHERLEFLCEHGRVVRVEEGWLYRQGDPASCFFVLLEGSLVMSRRVVDDEVEVNRTSYRGSYVGAWNAYLGDLVPQVYDQSVRVTETADFFELDAAVLREVMQEWFPMAQHLLSGLFVGFTNRQRTVSQRERLLALGSLSAGLTHELNNPAAAAARATAVLRDRFAGMRHKLAMLSEGKIDGEMLRALTELQEEFVARIDGRQELSALERSDREDALGEWLDQRAVTQPWELAGVFVAAGLGPDDLGRVADAVVPSFLEPALRWLAYTVETETLLVEIADSTGRVSALVDAAKQYSQMDRAPHQPTDVHAGLDATLVMLGAKIGSGIEVVKDYDRSLPKVPAYAGELNQVWTNLIHNALDALSGHGTLTLRTAGEGDCALIEIRDTGPGIPAELRQRVFEPFFTTKPVGHGTGLGLDVSWRIVVKRHGGDLRVTSTPGDTRFQVLLPLTEPTAPA